VCVAIAMMAVIAFTLTSLGLVIAWRIDSTQGFHAIMNLILLPIWILSGAFFPAEGAPKILWWTMELNPLTYGMSALRQGLYLGEPGIVAAVHTMELSIAITIAFAITAFALANRMARRASTI
jgi:ABC-2 type transport system permease protein